nr:cation transporter [Saprospiraceae bacterium]
MSSDYSSHRKYLKIILGVGLLLMVVKFTTWYLTNSNAVLSDAMESILNIGTGFFALYSLYISNTPKDKNHPYGHGKIEFVLAGIEGAMIALAGLFIIVKSGYNFFVPNEVTELETGVYLTVFSGGVNLLMGVVLLRRSKTFSNLILESEARHLISDGITSVGLIVGLLLILTTGFIWIDQVVAIGIGLLILYSGYKLIRTSIAGIMDEADLKLIEQIIRKVNANRKEEWIDLHNFRVIKYGSKLHVDCHLTVPWYFNQIEAHEEITDFEREVEKNCGDSVELFVHSDPCEPPDMCKMCGVPDCRYRKHERELKVRWTVDNVTPNLKIHLQKKSED